MFVPSSMPAYLVIRKENMSIRRHQPGAEADSTAGRSADFPVPGNIRSRRPATNRSGSLFTDCCGLESPRSRHKINDYPVDGAVLDTIARNGTDGNGATNGSGKHSLKIVILGLSITSSWGNGHATTYRGLVRELCARGHRVLFLERDQPWYADNRDLPKPPSSPPGD